MHSDTSRPAPHVLVVDDDAELCELMQLRLEHHGFRVRLALTAREALASLASQPVDAVVLDLRLGSTDGLDLLPELRRVQPELPVIVLTAHGSIETAVEATKRGAYGFLTKPFRDEELLEKLTHATQSSALERELSTLRRAVGEEGRHLLGTSPALARTRELISRVASSEVCVLIQGESGTGKELAARIIHDSSARASGPFVALNCAAVPAELLEGELFGDVRGARDGASRGEEGLLAAAEGGTLFLDEIGDASPAVQLGLLGVLQRRAYLPVGCTRERRADVRIIAATHRDLARAVREQTFREDLFYRLHVVPLPLPPLRECREDIPLLFERSLARAAAREGRAPCRLEPDARRLLLQHSWPGNVRELQNVAAAAAVLVHEGSLTAKHLMPLLRVQPTGESPPPSAPEHGSIELSLKALPELAFPSLRAARDAFDRLYLCEVLRRSNGNVSAAAKLASRNRSDFHELLRRHGISAADYRPGRLSSRSSPSASDARAMLTPER